MFQQQKGEGFGQRRDAALVDICFIFHRSRHFFQCALISPEWLCAISLGRAQNSALLFFGLSGTPAF